MQENELELVPKSGILTIEQIKEGMADAQNHRVYGRQKFAVFAFLFRQKVEKEEQYLNFMLSGYEHERASAHRYAQAGEVLLNLSASIDREWLPQSISQAVELSFLPKEQQVVVWDSLLDQYNPRKITQQIVADHVAALKQISAAPASVQLFEQSAVQEVEPAESELVEDDEPAGEDTDFDEPEEDEEPIPVPAPPGKRTSHFPNFPPLGCERVNRLKLLALGANFVRRVETAQGSVIYQWQESERSEGGWQQIHAGNVRQVDAYWDRLLLSATALDA